MRKVKDKKEANLHVCRSIDPSVTARQVHTCHLHTNDENQFI